MALQYPEAMQDAKNQFTAENPVQVSPDSQNRDYEHYEKDTDTDADHAVCIRQNPGFPRPLSTLLSVVFRYRKGQI